MNNHDSNSDNHYTENKTELSESEWLEMRWSYLNKMVMEKYCGEMSFEQIIKWWKVTGTAWSIPETEGWISQKVRKGQIREGSGDWYRSHTYMKSWKNIKENTIPR